MAQRDENELVDTLVAGKIERRALLALRDLTQRMMTNSRQSALISAVTNRSPCQPTVLALLANLWVSLPMMLARELSRAEPLCDTNYDTPQEDWALLLPLVDRCRRLTFPNCDNREPPRGFHWFALHSEPELLASSPFHCVVCAQRVNPRGGPVTECCSAIKSRHHNAHRLVCNVCVPLLNEKRIWCGHNSWERMTDASVVPAHSDTVIAMLQQRMACDACRAVMRVRDVPDHVCASLSFPAEFSARCAMH